MKQEDQPKSLIGKINVKEMGSRVFWDKPKIKKEVRKPVFARKKQFQQPQHHILNVEIGQKIFYQPKTKQNIVIYQQILNKIKLMIGDIPHDVLKSASDQIIAILRSDNNEEIKMGEIETIVGLKIEKDQYTNLIQLAKSITDYMREQYKHDFKDAVIIQEQEENQMEENVVEELDSEQQDIEMERIKAEKIQEEINQDVLTAQVIDKYWLQRKLGQYMQPQVAQKIESQVLQALKSEQQIECENKLLSLLNYDKFELIRQFMHHRHLIYFCTVYKQEQDQVKKEQIIQQLRAKNQFQDILNQATGKSKAKFKPEIQVHTQKAIEEQNFFYKIKEEEVNKLPKKIIDLNQTQTQFKSSFLNMRLPQGSTRFQKKGYEQIHIPSTKHKYDPNQVQIPIDTLPEWCQPVFKNINKLNIIQSKVYQTAMNSSQNLLVCAPTGAGKTNIAVLAILQVLSTFRTSSGFDNKSFKIVYVAPMKALVSQVTSSLSSRLQCLGITVKQLTGDMQLSRQQIDETQIIVSTPQKWDIITRKIGQKSYVENVRLLIIDQIHLLHDSRGPVLQAIIARTIRQIEAKQQMVRIIGLSATLPNYVDVATLLRITSSSGLFYFDNSYRPIPINQIYIGILQKKGVTKMILSNQILMNKVAERAGKVQIIIFVHSRKDTYKTALSIKEMSQKKGILNHFIREDSDSKQILKSITEQQTIVSSQLKYLLPFGFAIHHAGLQRSDRDLVQHLYSDRHIQLLVSTSTLAWGVNLPAHTVIIKGTQVYSPQRGKWIQLSPQEILQMIGRAGRPKFDTSGQGIIITGHQQIRYYLALLNMQMPIQSQMLKKISDHLNAQIILGNVEDLKDGVHWLSYTYLFVRMLRSPKTYGISPDELQQDPSLLKRRVNIIHTAATLLSRNNLIKYDMKTGFFTQTSLGKIASHYYIDYRSIANYNQHLKSNINMIELFKIFALSYQFKYIPVREEEKVQLNTLAQSIPVPIKGTPQDPHSKVSILLQAYISRMPLSGHALNCDMIYITQNAGRIMRAIFQICLKRGWGQSTLLVLNVSKMIEKGMWSCMTPLRQFPQIPQYVLARIEKKEQFLWQNIYQMTHQEIGELVKFPKLGKVLHKLVHQVPRLQLTAYAQPITRSCLKLQLSVAIDFQWQQSIHGKQELFYIFILDSGQEQILYYEPILLNYKQKNYSYHFTVPLFEIMHPLYFIKVVSDKWICSQTTLPLSFKSMILPKKFPPPTQLYDMIPVPITQIQEFQQIGQRLKIKQLNQIQTQVYKSFLHSKQNMFIGSSPSNGKFTLNLIVIKSVLQQNKKVVIILPNQKSLKNKQSQISQFFNCCSLIGHTVTDLELLKNQNLILSIPQYWDIVSRRWKIRKGFQQIGLFIVDDLHLLTQNAAVIQVIVSRMRYISNLNQNSFRIICFSASLADYRDVAQWIGATPQTTFNFAPRVKSHPVNISVYGFEQLMRNSRLQNMQRRFRQQLRKVKRSAIVFVSDGKQAKLLSLSLQFQYPIQPIQIQQIDNPFLFHLLTYRIGYIIQGMAPQQIQIVEKLYNLGKVFILIVSFKMMWSVMLNAQFVTVLDTEIWKEGQWQDYGIPEMLEMASKARINQKEAAKFHIYCRQSKKQFYSKFMQQPYPLQSHINHYLAGYINSEVVAKTIQSKQDCIDWITWTLMYRRLLSNPNFYNLHQLQSINNYLSQLIQNTVQTLQSIKCLSVQQDLQLQPLNLGIVCSYYYISIPTLSNFVEKIKENMQLREIKQLVVQANQFDQVVYRPDQINLVQHLAFALSIQISSLPFLILQAHINKIQLPPTFQQYHEIVIGKLPHLIHALVDILSSLSFLKPCIIATQLCQMVVQGLKKSDSPLYQIGLSEQKIYQLNQKGINDVGQFSQLSQEETGILPADVIQAVNRYPSVNLSIQVSSITDNVKVIVNLSRDQQLQSLEIKAARFPKVKPHDQKKQQYWWIFIGEKAMNKVICSKKVTFKLSVQIQLSFEPQEGEHQYSLYAICDSYMGCDQSQQFSFIYQAPQQIMQIQQ